ncbi:peptidoglycan-recognition protein LA isoform X3 [Drosophila obscura]|nr:peptidoglycan-recognition protein LA isoform X3 [Drosophila obscura]
MYEQNSSSSSMAAAAESALWSVSRERERSRPSAAQRLHNLTSASGTSSSASSSTALPQNIFTNPSIQPSSVVNLSHSTDVVIGPMTQYQGPVSIYYMDASMEAHAMQTAAGINSSSSSGHHRSRDNSPSKRLTRNTILLITLILLVLATALIVLYVELNRPRLEAGNKAIYFGNNYDHDT